GFNASVFVASNGYKQYVKVMGSADRIIVTPQVLSPVFEHNALHPPAENWNAAVMLADSATSIGLSVSPAAAELLMGQPITGLAKGTAGKTVTSDVHFTDMPRAGRNVIAILPGSDPRLRGEYVAIGAHNDHIPMQRVVDHDSLKVFNELARPQGADGGPTKNLSADEWKRVNTMIDSLHTLHGGPRPDSISNGADDDGSGTVTVLELAEAFAMGNVKPKRSILFIWHAGEEKGMWGSGFFTDHPTVPRDSIVAEINIDMVGRGAPSDMTGVTKDGQPVYGADKYVQLVGSRRLSTELGDLAETVNNDPKYGFKFDYSLDANGHPENIYCRSDHAKYAAWGIPVVFFTTGGHGDYHQVTDEPQYIRYDHMALLDNYIFDLANRVADLDHRLKVDGTKMEDPHGRCQQ
ncbi:MAG TPA: M28 family peptidase, partial [Gemmatimonadales bacterium]